MFHCEQFCCKKTSYYFAQFDATTVHNSLLWIVCKMITQSIFETRSLLIVNSVSMINAESIVGTSSSTKESSDDWLFLYALKIFPSSPTSFLSGSVAWGNLEKTQIRLDLQMAAMYAPSAYSVTNCFIVRYHVSKTFILSIIVSAARMSAWSFALIS